MFGDSSSNPSLFTGREYDGAGLSYYRARYFNPRFSRFISEDPLGIVDDFNPYIYAHNSPQVFVDPTGEYSQLACILGFTALGGATGAFVGAETGGTAGLVFAGVGAIPGAAGGAAAGAIVGGIGGLLSGAAVCPSDEPIYCAAEHKSKSRPSTKPKHEEGQSRKAKDRGGEKGDARRDPPRRRPPDWPGGPWPPKGADGDGREIYARPAEFQSRSP